MNWKFKFEACNCLTLRCQEFWLKFPLARCCMEGIDITLDFDCSCKGNRALKKLMMFMFNFLLISNNYCDSLTVYKDWTLTTPAKSYEPWKTIAAGRAPPLNVLVQYVIDIKPWSRFIDDLYRLDLTRLQLERCTFCCFARTQNRAEVQIKS